MSALVAYGIGTDNKRHLLGIHIGVSESEASWTELLTELVERGLSGVQPIIRDEHAGLAARKVLPEAKQQRCTVHLTRNVMSNVPKRHQKRLGARSSRCCTPKRRRRQAEPKAFRLQFFSSSPRPSGASERGFDDATTYCVPRGASVRIRTTNGRAPPRRDQTPHARHRAFPTARARALITAVALQVTSI
ncbi:MAG: transposase [Myxococcales bacterium]|nr:transposase [Myxococcales bacterium]